MKIMGLDNWLHWCAWFVKSMGMLMVSSIIITIFLKVCAFIYEIKSRLKNIFEFQIKWLNDVAVFTTTDWSIILLVLMVYTIASVCFCFMVATFFSKASTAAAAIGKMEYLFTKIKTI